MPFTVASNNALGLASFGIFFMELCVIKLKSSLFSQQHLAAIGSVAVESSNLEELLDIIIDGLLRLNTRQRDIVFEGAMMQRKLDLVTRLVATGGEGY